MLRSTQGKTLEARAPVRGRFAEVVRTGRSVTEVVRTGRSVTEVVRTGRSVTEVVRTGR